MTLDQYYYVSLEDTDGRDKDQVLYRYMERAHEALRTNKDGDDARSPNEKVKGRPAKKESKDPPKTKILMVHQLWLWVIDDSMFFAY